MTEHQTSTVESTPIPTALGIIAAGVAVALAAWGIVEILGIELETGRGDDTSNVGPADVAIAALVAGVGAWLVHGLLARMHVRAMWWPIVGTTVLAISMNGPSWLAEGEALVALVAMHFAVAIVLIMGFSLWGMTAPHRQGMATAAQHK